MVDSNDMAQEYVKAYTDKSRIYFIEKYLTTFDGTEGRNVPFVLFPRQKIYCEALGNDNKVISIKHRQCGISTTSCAWVSAQLTFAKPDSPETVLCIANKLEQACELLVKIRDFLEQVPRWYWGDEYYSADPNSDKNKKDIFIKNSKSYLELCNGCKVYAKAAGPNSARGVSSVSILILDEAAFMEEGPAAYASAVAATSAVANAKIIMVSTPNGKDELYYKTYKQAVEKKNGFTVVEFKWYQDLRYNRFLRWHRKNEKTGDEEWIVEKTIDDMGRIEYAPERWASLEKEGWKASSPWYIKMCESFNNDTMKIAQELDVSFLGSSDNVISAEVIEKIRIQDVCDPLSDYGDPTEELTWFWKRPIEGHRYIVACLPEGEKVLTRRGEIEAENVTDDDELLNKDGKWVGIRKRFVREVTDEEIVSISCSDSKVYHSFTWNHPIYASVSGDYSKNGGTWNFAFDFHKANELSIGDWVVFPNIYKNDMLCSIDENALLSMSHIYRRITSIEKSTYSGRVYNFEVDDETHTFCCMGITTHNCDPSRGSSSDRTSIQVIDADGQDEHGMPYFEQIMEYNGRVLGDKLGDLLYKYASLYNNGYIIVDATGGSGDACLLRLMNYWGYKNLYYDDNVMKQYMKVTQKSTEQFAERMPGFHFQGNRFSLLRNFANMVTDGAFTIHSVRLCNELDTWIFKGDDGRMDHMTASSHDDNITCVAMALFILKFSFQKLEASRSKDAAILNSYMTGGGHNKKDYVKSEKVFKNIPLQMYIPKNSQKPRRRIGDTSYSWLFNGLY